MFVEKGSDAGYLRVRMDSTKNKVKSVYFTNIRKEDES